MKTKSKSKSKKVGVHGPEFLDGIITEYSRKRQELLEKEKEEKKLKWLTEKEFWKNEQRLLPEKRGLLKLIFEWKRQFMKTEQFERLFNEINIDKVVIFGDGWGHSYESFSYGRWSRIYLINKGYLRYKSGYKWFPMKKFTLNNDEGTAKKLTCDYLRKLYNAIKTGQVYKRIGREIKEMEEYLI